MTAHQPPRRFAGCDRPPRRRDPTPSRPHRAAEAKQPHIELVYDADSPWIEDVRMALRLALREAGSPPDWHEWNRAVRGRRDPDRWFGSANVLVNGEVVAAVSEAGTIWRAGAGAGRILRAMRRAMESGTRAD